MTKGAVDFDQPFKKLGFMGVPFRETVQLQPTATSLVNLTSWVRNYFDKQDIYLQASINPNWHEGGHFPLPVLFGSDFVKNFQIFWR